MPQLDFVTNISVVHPLLLAIIVGYALSLECLNTLQLDVSEAAFIIKSLSPYFLATLTMKVLTFGWISLQTTEQATSAVKPRILTRRWVVGA